MRWSYWGKARSKGNKKYMEKLGLIIAANFKKVQ
jgi:hypothetical protein